MARLMISRMISLVPSRIWCTRTSRKHALDRMIAQIAVAAMQLQAAIDHLEAGIGGKALGLRGERASRRLALADRDRGAMQQQPRGLDLGRIVGDAELQRLEIGQPRAELLALFHVVDGAVEAELRAADRAGADVQAAAVEPGHGDLEALALGADEVGRRHAAILEHHHGGRLRFPAELLLLRAVGEARRALLHHDGGNAARARFAGARHHHVNVGDAAAGDEGLGAVEHIMSPSRRARVVRLAASEPASGSVRQ